MVMKIRVKNSKIANIIRKSKYTIYNNCARVFVRTVYFALFFLD